MNLMRTSIGSDVEPMDDLSKQSKVCSLKTLEGRKRSRPPDDACQAGRASPSVSAGFFGSAVAVSACRKAALLMICSPALEGSAAIPLLGAACFCESIRTLLRRISRNEFFFPTLI